MTRPPHSALDTETVAKTIYGEARSEGVEGMRAVAHVIANRVAQPRWWGKGWRGVCLKPKQFSCWNEGDPNRDRLLYISRHDRGYNEAYTIAVSVMGGFDTDDPTGGADHYHNNSVAPSWSDDAKRTAVIGRHIFYKLENGIAVVAPAPSSRTVTGAKIATGTAVTVAGLGEVAGHLETVSDIAYTLGPFAQVLPLLIAWWPYLVIVALAGGLGYAVWRGIQRHREGMS